MRSRVSVGLSMLSRRLQTLVYQAFLQSGVEKEGDRLGGWKKDKEGGN